VLAKGVVYVSSRNGSTETTRVKDQIPISSWRVVLVNNVLGALCQHILSLLLLPRKILHNVSSLILSFFWSNAHGEKSIHLLNKEVSQQLEGVEHRYLGLAVDK